MKDQNITIQERKMRSALKYAAHHSPFYKRLFAQNDIHIGDCKTLKDLMQLPTTSKSDLQENNLSFLCIDPSDVCDWVTTSGTLGTPVSFALSAADLDRLGQNEALSFRCAGCSASDVIQIMVTLDKQFMAGLAYYLGGRKLGATLIRVGSGSPGLQLDSIERFKPTVIISVPSFLLMVIDYAIEHNINMRTLSVNKIICIGEAIRDINLELNNLGQRIQSAWPEVSLISTYASTEMSTAITECTYGKGGHIPSDLVIVELLDEFEKPVLDGQPGEVTITTLGVEAMPLIRYMTGDVCIRYTDTCGCGRHADRLSPVLGRKKHMIKYKGTTLFPSAIYEVLNGIENVEHYVVLLKDTSLKTDDIKIYICLKNDTPKEMKITKELIRNQLRVLPTIEIIDERRIRSMKFPDASRKPIKLIDNRTKNINIFI